MAETYTREALDGGDLDVWGTFEQAQNHIALGLMTSSLFFSGGTLYLGKGKIGIDNGSTKGVIDISADKSISVALLTVSLWAKVELAVTAGVPVITITSIAGESDPATLPASFTAAYDGSKGAHYITATKRCVGLVWINAAGAVEGIVNEVPGCDGYSGYATSNDANDVIYQFLKIDFDFFNCLNEAQSSAKGAAFNANISTLRSRIVYYVTTAAASFNATVQTAVTAKGKRIRIIKVDTGAGVCTVIRTGAETLSLAGATAFPLRKQGDFIELESNGANWVTLDSLGTLDSAALAISAVQTLAHGIGAMPKKYDGVMVCISAEVGYSVDDEVNMICFYYDGTAHRKLTPIKDATNISIATEAAVLAVNRKDTGVSASITMNKWIIRSRLSI